MTVSYLGLWKILLEKGMQKQDLVDELGLSSATVAKMGKEAVKKLKAKNFGRHKWKNYPKGWKYKAGKFVSGNFECKIYNSTHGWLTHLLEHGHPIITKAGEKVGDAAAFPHIAPVQEWIDQELPRRIAEKMRKQ